MNCEQFRSIVGAEPNSPDAASLSHQESCAECARYRDEMQAMDRLIRKALEFQVSDDRIDVRRTQIPWRAAASFAIGLVFAASLWLVSTRDTLAHQAVEHAEGEAFAIVRTDQSVASAALDTVLKRAHLRLRPGSAPVSYASSCEFRGHIIPHLVVQTSHGPAVVLILTEEPSISKARRVDEDGYQGVIIPAPRGALVVLGHDIPAEEVAKTFLGSVEYL
jgi:Protein of unknown function (DUF3379)